jgi:hypothetical protein
MENDKKAPWWRHPFWTISGVIMFVLGTYLSLESFVDKRIQAVVTSDTFVRKVATEIRPAVIFDNKGSILNDQGAMQYINFPEVVQQTEKDPRWKNFPAKIIIHPKQYLAYAPLLTCLDPVPISVTSTRGVGFDWVYTFEVSLYGEAPVYVFRLEVLR